MEVIELNAYKEEKHSISSITLGVQNRAIIFP